MSEKGLSEHVQVRLVWDEVKPRVPASKPSPPPARGGLWKSKPVFKILSTEDI